jgi:hypothetical protein
VPDAVLDAAPLTFSEYNEMLHLSLCHMLH